MREWQIYTASDAVAGSLRLLPEVYSPQLDNVRSILVHLPPSYHSEVDRRYPVLYMQDGANLFDQNLAFSDEWQVDETLHQLVHEGIEAIVVGIPTTDARLDEYSPFVDQNHGGGKGEAYLDFVMQTIKPIIDEDFRTLPEQATTGILGSSMGGLISLYAFFRKPEVFGFAGALSPAIWFADHALLHDLDQLEQLPDGKLYFDAGRRELDTAAEKSAQYTLLVRHLRDKLVERGYHEGGNLKYIEDYEGTHSEQDWARRLPDALRFLLQN